MPVRCGYACINLVLEATTSHTLRLANAASTVKLKRTVQANLEDLRRILAWNAAHGVHVFRIGQGLIPFASHAEVAYDWQAEHGGQLAELGAMARELDQRLSMHPGQYVNPGSPDPGVVERSLGELRYSCELLDLLGEEEGPVVLHLGGAYGDKPAAAGRFAAVLAGEENLLRHLALEHDERVWTPAEVIEVATRLGVPVVVDNLHLALNAGDLTLGEALRLAWPTWGNRRPKVHLSSQDPAKNPGAHAVAIAPEDWDALREALPTQDVDVMVEAKGKEQALIDLGYPGIERITGR